MFLVHEQDTLWVCVGGRSAGEAGRLLDSCACVGLLEVTWDCHVFLKTTILRCTLG